MSSNQSQELHRDMAKDDSMKQPNYLTLPEPRPRPNQSQVAVKQYNILKPIVSKKKSPSKKQISNSCIFSTSVQSKLEKVDHEEALFSKLRQKRGERAESPRSSEILSNTLDEYLSSGIKGHLLSQLNVLNTDPEELSQQKVLTRNGLFRKYFCLDKGVFSSLTKSAVELLELQIAKESSADKKQQGFDFILNIRKPKGQDSFSRKISQLQHSSELDSSQKLRVFKMKLNHQFFSEVDQALLKNKNPQNFAAKQTVEKNQLLIEKLEGKCEAAQKEIILDHIESNLRKTDKHLYHTQITKTFTQIGQFSNSLKPLEYRRSQELGTARHRPASLPKERLGQAADSPPGPQQKKPHKSSSPSMQRVAESSSLLKLPVPAHTNEAVPVVKYHVKEALPRNTRLLIPSGVSSHFPALLAKSQSLAHRLSQMDVSLSREAAALVEKGDQLPRGVTQTGGLRVTDVRSTKTVKSGCEDGLGSPSILNVEVVLDRSFDVSRVTAAGLAVDGVAGLGSVDLDKLGLRSRVEKPQVLPHAGKSLSSKRLKVRPLRDSQIEASKPPRLAGQMSQHQSLDQEVKQLVFVAERGKYADHLHILNSGELEQLSKLTKHSTKHHRLAAYKSTPETAYMNYRLGT